MDPLENVTRRVMRSGNVNAPSTPRPLLTLAEFFDGNKDIGSIGCNLVPTPTPAEFREVLERIAARPEVAEVRVQITMFDDPQRWPFSDTVWIITNADATEVSQWFDSIVRPDATWNGWTPDAAFEPCPVPSGMHPVACWWD